MKTTPTIIALGAVFVAYFACLGSVSAQSGQHLYQVFVSASYVTTNDFGRLVPVFIDSRDIVRTCARDNGYSDSRALTLVYDRDADALQVVVRSNGVVVCTPYVFAGGVSLTNASRSTVERLAFVYADGSDTASGTLEATERFSYNIDGDVTRFTLAGRLQVAVTPENARTKIVSARIFSGQRFFPGRNY